jgi:hypothetical protein
VLSPASVAAMEAPHANVREVPGQSYGYALFPQTFPYDGHLTVQHSGAVPGYSSTMYVVPDLGFAVVALVNSLGDGAPYEDLAQYAMSVFIADKKTKPDLYTPSSAWGGYVGTYDDAWGVYGNGMTVSFVDGGASPLVFDAPNALDESHHIAPIHGTMGQLATDSWLLPDGNQATFFPNDAGASTYLVTRSGTGIRP